LESSTRFGGMENATAIFYADQQFRKRTMTDGVVAHETAHQWFGDAVTETEWSHLWLSEGFATYLAALWTRKSAGDSAFRAEMEEIRRVVLSITQAARFGSYRFPLTIDIKTVAGRRVRTRVDVTAQTSTRVTLDPPLDTTPAELVFDADVELLARIVGR